MSCSFGITLSTSSELNHKDFNGQPCLLLLLLLHDCSQPICWGEVESSAKSAQQPTKQSITYISHLDVLFIYVAASCQGNNWARDPRWKNWELATEWIAFHLGGLKPLCRASCWVASQQHTCLESEGRVVWYPALYGAKDTGHCFSSGENRCWLFIIKMNSNLPTLKWTHNILGSLGTITG